MARSDRDRRVGITRFGVGVLVTLLGMLAMSCEGSLGASTAASTGTGGGPAGSPPSASDIGPCPQDPDWALSGMGHQQCPDYWQCTTLLDGTKRCTNPGPRAPDGNHEWACEDTGGRTVCSSPDAPDGGGGGDYSCEQQGELWVCTSNGPPATPPDSELPPGTPPGSGSGGDYPGGGSGSPWDCYFTPGPDGPARVCEAGPPTSSTPPGPGGDVPPPSPGGPGSPTPNPPPDDSTPPPPPPPPTPPPPPPDRPMGPPGCVCIPGAERFCDTPTYCSWGKQVCGPDGQWGSCNETSPPALCAIISGYYYDTACCLAAGGCCQNYPIDNSSVGDCGDITCR